MAEARADILLSLKTRLEGNTAALAYLRQLPALITAAAASTPILLLRQFGQLAEQIKTLAGQAQMSTDAFQTLKLEMGRDGVEAETFVQALTRLRQNLQDAHANDKSPMNQALRDLHLTAEGMQALKPEEQLQVIAQRLATVADHQAALNAATDLLGAKSAPKLIEALKRLNAEGYEKWFAEVRALRVDQKGLDTLSRAADNLKFIAESVKTIGMKGSAGLIGAAEKESEAQQKWLVERIVEFAMAKRALSTYLERLSNPFTLAGATPDAQPFTAAPAAPAAADEAAAKMAAAEAKAAQDYIAHLGEVSSKLQQSDTAHTAALLEKGLAKVREEMAKTDEQLTKDAEHYKEIGDPQHKYQEDLQKIADLQFAGKLTAEEAAAAIAAVKNEMERPVEKAIDASNDALRGLGNTLAQLEANPYLTDREKAVRRIDLLKQENGEIQTQIDRLKQLSTQPGVDPAAIRGQIRGLQDRQASNTLDIGRSTPTGGVRDNLLRDVVDMEKQLGTVSENLAHTISGTVGGAFDSVRSNLTALIMGTESWHDTLRNIGTTIETDLIGSIVKMFVAWAEQRIIQAVFGETLAAASLAALAPIAAAESAIWATPATLATIASFGGAAVAAPGEISAAQMLVKFQSIMALAEGGIVTGPGGPRDDRVLAWLSNGEGVLNAAATRRVGADFVNALNAGAAVPVGNSSGGSAGGRRERTIVIVGDMHSARALQRDPHFTNIIVDTVRNNRGAIAEG
jgi:hypothetical protein